jgi:tRNA threonylcarbamoyladenosine biosynthesis protein TsaE
MEPGSPQRLYADELNQFGEGLGRSLTAPAVIGFSGDLGTGKTTLIQAVCRGLGAQALATSPTYALVHHYEAGDKPIYHVDCYRLKSPEEARELGFEDMLRQRAIILIEWPERGGPWTPPLDRHFRLSYLDEAEMREVTELR